MYSRHRWKELRQKIQTLLSQKRRKFCGMVIGVLESTQNFAHFEEKDQLHSLNISELIDPDKSGYFNGRKLLF